MRKNKDYMQLAYKELCKYITEHPTRRTPKLGAMSPLTIDTKGIITVTYTSQPKYHALKTSTLFKFYPNGRFDLFTAWHAGNRAWISRMDTFCDIVNVALTPHNRRIHPSWNRMLRFETQRMVPRRGNYWDQDVPQEGLMQWHTDHQIAGYRGYRDQAAYHRVSPDKTDFWGLKEAKGPRDDLKIVKDWSRRKWYKIMKKDGLTQYARFRWDMPTVNGCEATADDLDPTPGAWHEVEGDLTMCGNGIHICQAKDIGYWWGSNSQVIVEMEVGGPVYMNTLEPGDNKQIVRKARIKRIVAELETGETNNARKIISQLEIAELLIKGHKLPAPHTMTFERTVTTRYTETFTGKSKNECRHKAAAWQPQSGYNYNNSTLRNTLKQVKNA